MKIFSVIGVSKSGKTATIEKIIDGLRKRGFSVGSIKEIHNEKFSMDTSGTNTDRHKKSGSQLVTARGLYETDVLYQKKLDIEDILCHYSYDYIVLEGVADIDVQNIITAHTEKEIEERLNKNTIMISGRISEKIDSFSGITAINALTDIDALLDVIEEKTTEYKTNTNYCIIKNGKKQPLNAWQNLMLAKALRDLDFEQIIQEQVVK